MEKKRYQVFVSSTYVDLIEERSALFDAVSQLDCISAGMETFPAFDEEQLEYIKKIIDDSDYYVLVLAGRYGSVSERKISFTEEEYDYAVDRGIPVLAFIHSKPEEIPIGKTDRDEDKRQKLAEFIAKAGSGRLVKYWSNVSELSLRVTQSLNHAIKARPGIGWIRGDSISDYGSLQEINRLQKENLQLRVDLDIARSAKDLSQVDFDDLKKGMVVRMSGYTKHGEAKLHIQFDLTLQEIFCIIGPAFYKRHRKSAISEKFKLYAEQERGQSFLTLSVHELDQNTMVASFVTAGLFKQDGEGVVVLTPAGELSLTQLLTK